MKSIIDLPSPELSDADLVSRSAAGDRKAFEQIVSRYQTLVCSLAYSGTGNLTRSEDLAQETFLAAWKQLRRLREPSKLRSWLCGIVRNLVNNSRRSARREPVVDAASMDAAGESPALDPLPSDEAITREQQAILCRALGALPENYREPLILFYREEKSVARVALELELSEDAVKQRLARGRKLLRAQVAAFVEGALARTAPGPTFTSNVMGALPLFLGSSFTATGVGAGGTVAKGGLAGIAGSVATVAMTVIGPIVGLLGAWVGVKASLAATRTPRERAYVVRFLKAIGWGIVVFGVLMGFATAGARTYGNLDPVWLAGSAVTLSVAYLAWVTVLSFRCKKALRRIREEEKRLHPKAFVSEPVGARGEFKEYRSRASLLGLPLIHVRVSTPAGEETRPAIGWIAIGDHAVGVLFALGGLSIGCVSIGGVSAGLISIGGASLGAISIGGLALGGLAIGGAAVGWVATGGIAFAWLAAEGGYAAACEFALGAHASAAHANDVPASDFFAARPWMDVRGTAGKLVLSLIWLPSLLVIVQYRRIRRIMKGSYLES